MRSNGTAQFLAKVAASKLLSSTFVLLTLAIGILIGTFVAGDVGAADGNDEAVAPDATPLTVPDPTPVDNQFAGIAKQVRPSVVNIRVEQAPRPSRARGEANPQSFEDQLRRFFMPDTPEGPGPRIPGPGEGSGLIVDVNGYALTNFHVVESADRVRVRFSGEEEMFEAKVIGLDEETDLAVIKIDLAGRHVEPARIGNSEAVNVGDWAIAVGSPFGYRESVTVGIISAKGRAVQGGGARSSPFQKFFQTDAAINPGNSGGPLVNIRGEVIGINTAIVSRTGAYAGLGFALPSNTAVNVYNQIIKSGRVARGSIGITFHSSDNNALLKTHGVGDGGVFVKDVKEDGPADHAGMEAEDVITHIDGVKISDGDQLIAVVAATPVGDTIPIRVVRNGERLSLDVKVADRAVLFASELGLSELPDPEEPEEASIDLGIEVQNLTAEFRTELDFEEDGVLITTVEPRSFAEEVGLIPNDVIVRMAINTERYPIGSLDDLRDARAEIGPGEAVEFKVMRRGAGGWRTEYLAGTFPKDQSGRFD